MCAVPELEHSCSSPSVAAEDRCCAEQFLRTVGGDSCSMNPGDGKGCCSPLHTSNHAVICTWQMGCSEPTGR
jgi:hypothetical protein